MSQTSLLGDNSGVVLGTQMIQRKVVEKKSLLSGLRVRLSEGAAGDGDEGADGPPGADPPTPTTSLPPFFLHRRLVRQRAELK